jgi:hypothetical protein
VGRNKPVVEIITRNKYKVDNDFVCAGDILRNGVVYGLNPVIYNRLLTPEENKRIVYNHIMERFNVSLTDEQLSELCDQHLMSVAFIKRLKKMIR